MDLLAMTPSHASLLRLLWRLSVGRLFPDLSKKIVDWVFRSERRQLTEQSEKVAKCITLLENCLSHLYDSKSQRECPACSVGDLPLVSIIMPTYDRAHCIADAIESVCRQRYQCWELIIIDDGSTDLTREIIAPFLRDRRICYVRQDHRGHSNARNHGLVRARGKIVTYLDSDNVALPAFLAVAVATFAGEPTVDFVYGALLTREHGNDGGAVMWEPFDREMLLTRNFIDLNVVAHRRVLFDRYGGFDESLDRLTDWDLALRYTAHAPARPIPVLAAQYRIRDRMRISNIHPFEPAYRKVRQKWAAG